MSIKSRLQDHQTARHFGTHKDLHKILGSEDENVARLSTVKRSGSYAHKADEVIKLVIGALADRKTYEGEKLTKKSAKELVMQILDSSVKDAYGSVALNKGGLPKDADAFRAHVSKGVDQYFVPFLGKKAEGPMGRQALAILQHLTERMEPVGGNLVRMSNKPLHASERGTIKDAAGIAKEMRRRDTLAKASHMVAAAGQKIGATLADEGRRIGASAQHRTHGSRQLGAIAGLTVANGVNEGAKFVGTNVKQGAQNAVSKLKDGATDTSAAFKGVGALLRTSFSGFSDAVSEGVKEGKKTYKNNQSKPKEKT